MKTKKVSEKKKWDPDFIKRKKMKDILDKLISEFSLRIGGMTSVDVTKPGIDKDMGSENSVTILAFQLMR